MILDLLRLSYSGKVKKIMMGNRVLFLALLLSARGMVDVRASAAPGLEISELDGETTENSGF